MRSPSGIGYVPVPGARQDPPLTRGATGPIPGVRGPRPGGRAAELEGEALAAEGIGEGAFEALPAPLRSPGTRRALRVPVQDVELTWEGDRARLAFFLPAGSYATTLLEELVKAYGPGTSFQAGAPS